MTEISLEKIKDLREKTGVGMSKCKEALVAAKGDIQQAIDYLRKAGMASAVKKESRETKEGLVFAKEGPETIVLIEGNAETDFVTKNERFHDFLDSIAEQALQSNATTLDQLMEEKYYKDSSLTVEDYRKTVVQALGENIQIKRIEFIPKEKNTSYGIYSHMGGKIVSIVSLLGSADQSTLAKDIAMHVAAENPQYLTPQDVPEEVKEKEKEIARTQIKGKPENIVEKILEGKIRAFCDQECLVCQKFIKDPTTTIQQLLGKKSKEIDSTLQIISFWRWKVA